MVYIVGRCYQLCSLLSGLEIVLIVVFEFLIDIGLTGKCGLVGLVLFFHEGQICGFFLDQLLELLQLSYGIRS